MRNMWYLVKWQESAFTSGFAPESRESVTIRTEEGDGLDTILGEILRGVVDKTLEVMMVTDDGEDD